MSAQVHKKATAFCVLLCPPSAPNQGSWTNDNDEVSPHGRYVKLSEILGSGAYKDVWRAYDTLEGMEVAWNVVKLGMKIYTYVNTCACVFIFFSLF